MNKNYQYRFFTFILLAGSLVYAVGIWRPAPVSSLIKKEKFWAEKVHSKRKYQVVFSGDSRLYRGIDPKTVSETLGGLSVLNFGFSSGGHNNAIFDEINYRLDQNSSLKAVVLVLSPYSLTPKAQQNEHYNQEKNRDRKEVFNRRYVNPFFSFLDPIKPSEIIRSRSGQNGYYERFQNDGWVASWKIPSDSKAALKGYVKDFENNTVQGDILEVVYDQIRNWKAMGVQVFAFRIPSTEDMEKLEQALSGFQEAAIQNGVEQSGGEWIAIKNRFEYESYDGSHLTKVSASKLSEQIGNELKKRLKGL